MFEIRTFRAGDEAAFFNLNQAWVEKLFAMEPKDVEVLSDPAKYILAPGGEIFMAMRHNEAVGCCALLPQSNGTYEISKMTVMESLRGQGLGKQLLRRTISYAKERGVARLYLETNLKLRDAIHLYESMGFQHVPNDRLQKSPYRRADVYMELWLEAADRDEDALNPQVEDRQRPISVPNQTTRSAE